MTFRARGVAAPRLGGPEAWLVWVLATTFVVWVFAIQTGYAVVSSEIQDGAGLSLGQIGLAASIYTWVFALVQFFSGALLDRFGSRPLLTIAVALVAVGAFLYAGTTTFATLAIAQTVLALGASFGFVGAGYIGGRWFPPARYGLMFGLVQACASLGAAVGQPVVRAALDAMSWQQLLLGFATFGVLLAVLFAVVVRDPRIGATDAAKPSPRRGIVRGILGQLGRCLRRPNVTLAAVLAGAAFGTMLSIGTLWGPRIMEARGADTTFATALTATAWLGLAVGAPLITVVSDRWGSRRWPAVAALVAEAVAIVFVIYVPLDGTGVTVAAMFAVGLFSGVQMLGFAVAAEAVGGSLIGSSAAIVNGVCFLLGGLLISVPGALLPASPQLMDYRAVLWLLPAVLVVGVIAALLLREPRRSSHGAARS